MINIRMNLVKHIASFKDEPSSLQQDLFETVRTLPLHLDDQVKNKYKTFTKFNYRQAIQQSKAVKRKRKDDVKSQQVTAILNTLLTTTLNTSQAPSKNQKPTIVTQQMAGIKSERRERFKKLNNTYQIIKHYIEKEGFKPTEQELYLMKSLSELRQFTEQNNLDSILRKIYRVMNEAVDFNQLRFLCLLIHLAADISYQHKDFKRAFYFYNQARLYASYSLMISIKTQSLFCMGLVALELKLYKQAIIIFKKSLQYAWKAKDVQTELLIYDYIGTALYYQGQVKSSKYFHIRFAQGQYEHQDSAIKKISAEMLQDYEAHLNSLEKKNLTSLFLQYINIPIVGLEVVSTQRKKIYENYDEEGYSPRKKRKQKAFELQDFPQANFQIERVLTQDYQFKTQIPNPDVQPLFVPSQKFGKYRKQVEFQQSSQFHKIVGFDPQKVDLRQFQSKSMQKQIDQILSERKNPDWWGQMKDKIRKNQLQKVGQLRERIRNSHQSYNKYPDERRRAYSLKNEKIKQSFNKTLLDWIDPK